MSSGHSRALAGCCLLALCAVALFGCSPERTRDLPASDRAPLRPNLILISIDTLRADRLGAYGYDRPTTPSIDRLALRGTRFANAITPSPWTLPAHMSLFTGLEPASHGIDFAGKELPRSIETLGERLASHGYRNFAFTTGGFLAGAYGFERGFERYYARLRPVAGILRRARETIQSLTGDEPYFLFLQTYDVHCPFVPPARYREMFVTRPPADQIEAAGLCRNRDFPNLHDGQVAHLSDLYDADIRATDDALNGFFAFLDEREELDETILVLLSDHGEEFREHGAFGHGSALHAETVRIPLIVAGSGITRGVVSERVSLIDVFPTLLELAGVPVPATPGRSLVPFLRGETNTGTTRPLFAETDNRKRLRSVLQDEWHLIVDLDTEEQRLYDVVRDPRETRDLAAARPRVRERLASLLQQHGREAASPPVETRALAPEHIEELRALGYVE